MFRKRSSAGSSSSGGGGGGGGGGGVGIGREQPGTAARAPPPRDNMLHDLSRDYPEIRQSSAPYAGISDTIQREGDPYMKQPRIPADMITSPGGDSLYFRGEPSAPHIETSRLQTPMLIRAGDSAALDVEVHGNPSPRVRWYVGRTLIQGYTEGFRIEQDGYLHSMVILDADEDINRGIFVTATNDYGQDQRKLDVKHCGVSS